MADKKQRFLNKHIRDFNKAIGNDLVLGKDRFHILQKGKYGRFSEGTRVYLIEVVDTKTSETVQFIVDDYNHSRKLFWGVNDFILQIRKKENW